MKILKWMGASTSRRNSRLWLLRLKKFGLVCACLIVAGGLALSGWRDGFFSRTGGLAHQEMLSATAKLGFRVSEIFVTGRYNTPQEELLARLAIRKNSPIFGVSIKTAQEEISHISWIRTARISRRLPDKIIVDIVERKPVALWQYRKKVAAIDMEGKVLTTEALDRYQNLPLVVGEGASSRVAQMIGILKAEPDIAAAVTSAVRVGGRRWDLHLKNGVTVKLPEEDVELALRKLARAQETGDVLGKDIAVLDLRLTDKMVLEMKTGETKSNI